MATNVKATCCARSTTTSQSGKCTFEMIRFVLEAGTKLKAQPITVATAACIYHRFQENMQNSDLDQQLVASVALYLAGKVEENHLRIRDVINVCHRMVTGSAETLGYDEEYFNLRSSFVHLELLMLRVLRFQVNFTHPHKYLLHYFWSLSRWLNLDTSTSLSALRAAWSFVHDLLHSPQYLKFKPQHIAVGAIYLSLQCYGIVLPCEDGSLVPWYQAFTDDLDEYKVWEIVEVIIKNYEQETLPQSQNISAVPKDTSKVSVS